MAGQELRREEERYGVKGELKTGVRNDRKEAGGPGGVAWWGWRRMETKECPLLGSRKSLRPTGWLVPGVSANAHFSLFQHGISRLLHALQDS